MAIGYYFDHNVKRPIEEALKQRGYFVVSAFFDGRSAERDDAVLLDRAGQLGLILFTMDTDLLIEAARRQHAGEPFTGIVYIHQDYAVTALVADDLAIIAEACTLEELANTVVYLPL